MQKDAMKWIMDELDEAKMISIKSVVQYLRVNLEELLDGKKYHAARRYAGRLIERAKRKKEGFIWIEKNLYHVPLIKNMRRKQSKLPKQYPKIERFLTEHCGWGVRACEDIKSDVMLGEYLGEVINQEMHNSREMKKRNAYVFYIHKDRYVDAERMGNMMRFINHSCKPNALAHLIYVKGEAKVVITTMKKIQSGEEISINYGDDYIMHRGKCQCDNCR
jgi:predicted PilT family ATPase